MNAPFLDWRDGGFGADLLPICGPDCKCGSAGKVPHLPNWQMIRVDGAKLAMWARTWRGNIGLRTRRFPALDIDVDDPAIADACERVALTVLGSTARRMRTNTSRRLLLYQLEGEPLKKRIVKFTLPTGAGAKVELLGDGQQCVVTGTHHSGAAIQWKAGQPRAKNLATISAALADELVGALRKRLVELGCKVEPAVYPVKRTTLAPSRTGGREAEIAAAALQRLDPDLPYDGWIKVGMAIHAALPGDDGFSLWDAWSSRGQKYPGSRVLESHWRSFHAGGGVGFGTLVAMAREAGRL